MLPILFVSAEPAKEGRIWSAPRLLICFLLLSSPLFLASSNQVRADDRKTTSELVRSRGFNVEEFDVISQNYVLKVYRIINPLADPETVHRIPVIAHHGISWDMSNMMSSSQYARPRKPKLYERVTLYARENGTDDKGLHFYLSNNNYDVWLLEARAVNEKTRKRIADESNKKSFWDFSIDEQALIDLPTQIDFVLMKTGAPKAAYIAFSQSTTLMFALLSMRPDYSEKLACFIALAPVVYTGHMKGAIWPTTLAKVYSTFSAAVPFENESFRRISNFFFTYACSISFIKNLFCKSVWEAISGPMDKGSEMRGGIYENVQKSTSLKTFEQYDQNALSKDFRMYDYKDEQRNMEEYGQVVPPQYNVSKINLKTIALFRGTEDYLSDPQDQMILLSRLRVPLYEDHILVDYSHIDFLISPTVVRDVNEPILRILDRTTNRMVHLVSHTLDPSNPNPQVEGTPLVMDAKEEFKEVKSGLRSQNASLNLAVSGPDDERRAHEGVSGRPSGQSVREQLLSKK